MGKHFILAGQRSGGHLRHHEAGIEPGPCGQKWWQAFVERRIHQSFDSSLRDSSQRSKGNAEIVECESDRFTVKISAGEHVAFADLIFARSREDERIINCRIHLDLKCPAGERNSVANCSMDLRNATQGICVLDALAIFM